MQDREISIAKAGGTIGRSKFFDAAIDERLREIAPHARVVALQMKPAEAAAKMAIGLGKRKAHGRMILPRARNVRGPLPAKTCNR